MNEATSLNRNHDYKACYNANRCIFNGLGLTKLLVLNRKTYHEAIRLLLAYENILRIHGVEDKAFGNPWLTGNRAFFLVVDQHPKLSWSEVQERQI